MANGILLCGANGSGKTTLGMALAKALHAKHMDIEDYTFLKSQTPYAKSRSRDEVRLLLQKDMNTYRRFILTAVTGDMGEEINSMYRCAIYLSAPLELRLRRIKQRSYQKFRERMLPGGDLYEQEQRFFQFAASRSMEETEKCLKALPCPVIYADGTKEISENVKWLAPTCSTLLEQK